MPDFNLMFNLDNYKNLDNFALLASQKYNYGNDTDWFGSFRGGLYGGYARIFGAQSHYNAVHAWVPKPRAPSETEYHLASLFFSMDSLVECIVFALNALGCGASGSPNFRDVTSAKDLRQISPNDILGRPNKNTPEPHLPGYDTYFPEVRKLWESKKDFLSIIFEQHNVSKHRETIFVGGKHRTTPPPGFFESIGINPENPFQAALFWPMEEIILKDSPATARIGRTPQPVEEQVLLENLVPDFKDFIEKTGELAFYDAKANIPLKANQFKGV